MKKQVGVYICHCGTNIAATVDCAELAQLFRSLPGVKVARDYRYLCSDPGQDLIKKDIHELSIDRVVVAGGIRPWRARARDAARFQDRRLP